MLTVGDREVRVSSPDRVVYEATDWAPEVTKLQVCEYFIGVAPAFMRASATVRSRWSAGPVGGARA
jgi:DNA primase